MSVVLLKNLFQFKRPLAPRAKSARSAKSPHPPSQSPIPAIDRVVSPPLHSEKHPEGSWIETTSSADLEAQTSIIHSSSSAAESPKCKKEPQSNDSSQITSWFRKACLAVRTFRPTPRMISDAIIGLSDGMTVPFALTAGLSSLGNTRIVVLGGLAELIAGMISMGVGGALGAKAESEGYKASVADTTRLVTNSSAEASALVHDVLHPFDFDLAQRDAVTAKLMQSTERMVDYLMRFHHQEKQPDPSRPMACGITIGLGYALGGLIPLIPYFCVGNHEVLKALWISVGTMVVTLFLFGYGKTVLLAEKNQDKSTWKAIKGGLEMVAIGGGSAAVAVGLVHGINSNVPE
ncbi:MAG: hypothetical protein L6R35_005511 [Caloplaca aegaea]|nr:MAG: hypothetical protein L6R35_005511 [Caloplaca aegaea]